MAANNASKMSKAISQIASSSVGSPKKAVSPVVLPSSAVASGGPVFIKTTGVRKRVVSSVVNDVKTMLPVSTPTRLASGSVFKKPTGEHKRAVSTGVKDVKTTLSVPPPTRRPPSMPLSPWNADHSHVVKKSLRESLVRGAKTSDISTNKGTPRPKPKPIKSATPNTTGASTNKMSKSTPKTNAKRVSNNGAEQHKL